MEITRETLISEIVETVPRLCLRSRRSACIVWAALWPVEKPLNRLVPHTVLTRMSFFPHWWSI